MPGGKQRGRKSAEKRELALLVKPTDLVPRPEPPAELTAEESDEWIALCNVVPADYFPPASHAVVMCYCRHVVLARHIGQLIRKCERAKPFDERRYLRLCRAQQQETTQITHCLRTLRLTHLSVHARDRMPVPVEMAKPWEG